MSQWWARGWVWCLLLQMPFQDSCWCFYLKFQSLSHMKFVCKSQVWHYIVSLFQVFSGQLFSLLKEIRGLCGDWYILMFNLIFSLVFVPFPVEITLMFIQDHIQPFRSGRDQSLSPQTFVPGALSGFSAQKYSAFGSPLTPADITSLCILI